ncbi:Asp-tRNA(Asn)/Glu-tRNA(Gln) amidotransferase subunit GatC [Candidatus Nomurabacteria bacterium]|nr:Asp-tRNA(Asn)/Glu-tRNA(Gln) amidotransferase subunit GatC [Candidatus Nomurabacteria bacterium]
MDIKDVENLAKLARIELSEEEKRETLSDMKDILDYVKQIENVRVDDIKTEYDITNVWREDEIEIQDFSKELIIGQFPDVQNGFLKVKKIL